MNLLTSRSVISSLNCKIPRLNNTVIIVVKAQSLFHNQIVKKIELSIE